MSDVSKATVFGSNHEHLAMICPHAAWYNPSEVVKHEDAQGNATVIEPQAVELLQLQPKPLMMASMPDKQNSGKVQ